MADFQRNEEAGEPSKRARLIFRLHRAEVVHSLDRSATVSIASAGGGWAMSISCYELPVVAVTSDGATCLCRWMWPTVAHNYPVFNPLYPSSSHPLSVAAKVVPDRQPDSLCWATSECSDKMKAWSDYLRGPELLLGYRASSARRALRDTSRETQHDELPRQKL